jgi:hypothetical protein
MTNWKDMSGKEKGAFMASLHKLIKEREDSVYFAQRGSFTYAEVYVPLTLLEPFVSFIGIGFACHRFPDKFRQSTGKKLALQRAKHDVIKQVKAYLNKL